jgi:hypothetical protein
MPKRKITQQDEANALQEFLEKVSDANFLRQETDVIKYISLSQFFDEAPMSISYKASLIVDALIDLADAVDNYEPDFTSFNSLKDHFKTFAKDDLTGSYDGISLTAQQVKTILSSSDVFSYDKSMIFISSRLFSILDEGESAQIFETLLFKDPEFDQEQKLFFASDSLYFNFNLLTKDMYESLMSNYKVSEQRAYADLLLSSAACPRTKDWVKKEYFSNVLEDVALEWSDFDNEELLLIKEAQQDLFGE